MSRVSPPSPVAPDRVGRYRVTGILGRGGMGDVFRAHDPDLDRDIALKCIRVAGGGSSGSESTQRLVREARAMARLSHPNVISVFNVETDGDQIYIAMELVDGVTLRAWTKEPRHWRRVVEVFVQAGQGLAAAHASGIVHRDFKPSNVLVGNDDRVRVLDFGLAQVAGEGSHPASAESGEPDAVGSQSRDSEDRLTASGVVMGTPAYMAPEQGAGAVATEASDQYSFCVALFEALYGERPPRPRDRRAAPSAPDARDEVPRADVPKAVHRAILRGLESDPERRWSSMSELLARLEPPRRRPIALAVAAGAFVVAAVAAALARTADACPADTALETLWTGHRRSELGQALDADGSEEKRAAWERALPRLDEYASGLHRELAAVCEVEDEQVADARRRCLARHAAHFDGLLLSATTGTKPDVWRLLEGLGRLPAVDGCTELSDAEEPRPSDPELAREVDRIRAELARVDAITTLADARCAEDGAPVDEAAHAVGFPPLLAEVDMVLGSCDMMTEQFDRATERLERSYLVATEHGHDLLAARAANALVSMNGLRLGNIEEAETWLRNAEAAIVRAGDPLEERIRLQQTSGSLREVQGRYDECEALLRAGREGALRLLPPSPSAVATLTQNLAICLDVGGRPEEAEPLYREALQIRIDDVGEMTPVVGETLLSLAAAMDTMSRFDERDELNERARMVLERTRGADSPQLGILLSNLSSTERQRGNLPMARAHAERALEILRRTLGEDSPYTAGAWNQLGRSAEFEQAWDEALRHYARAIAIFEAAFGPSHPNIATVLLNVATIHQGAGRFDEGEAAFGRALEIRRQANGPDSPEVWWLIESIGLLHREAGRLEEAEREIREGLAGLERTAPDPALVALAQFHLAETLRRADRSPDEARRLAHAALQTFETVKMQDRADAVRAWLADGG